MLTDLDGNFQVALLSDELTGFVFARSVMGATEFMRAVAEFYEMLRQIAPVQPAARFFRCRIYTDEMAALRAFLQQIHFEIHFTNIRGEPDSQYSESFFPKY